MLLMQILLILANLGIFHINSFACVIYLYLLTKLSNMNVENIIAVLFCCSQSQITCNSLQLIPKWHLL